MHVRSGDVEKSSSSRDVTAPQQLQICENAPNRYPTGDLTYDAEYMGISIFIWDPTYFNYYQFRSKDCMALTLGAWLEAFFHA
jgi:hypothetical protein